eukprot:373604_1
MGAFSSRPNICPYCTINIRLPDDDDDKDGNTLSQQSDESIFCCSRCNGALKLRHTKPASFDLHPQPIQYLHIFPFDNEGFKISDPTEGKHDQKIDNNTILVNEYLKPFFNKNSNIFIQNGNRLLINNIEFKIFGCYPPYGYV